MLDYLVRRQDTSNGGSTSGSGDTSSGSSTGANDPLLKLIANPFQAQIQINAFWASLGTSVGITILLAIVFSVLRPRHTLVYAPKVKHADAKHAPPPMGKDPWSWIPTVAKTKEQVLVDKIGTDAVVFLRFTRMLRNIFCILGVLGVVIMIPVNITQGNKAIQDHNNAFSIMTPLTIFGGGLWAQVVMAYVINLVVAYFLWYNYRKVFRLRRDYLESSEYQQSLHSRTLLLRHLPSNLCSEEGIIRVTDEVNPTGVSPQARSGRNVQDLPELLEKHEEAVRKIESVLAKYLKHPEKVPSRRPLMKAPKDYQGPMTDGKIDSIEYYRQRIQYLEDRIADVREQVDQRDAAPYGFATWDHVSQAHAVAFAARKKKPQGSKIRLAPRPNDLIWKNLTLNKSSLKQKRIMNFVYIALLTVIWTPLNAAIAIFLSNLSNLGSVWPAFQRQLEANKGFWSLVQGILAPAITSGVYLVLPIIFRRLQIRAGDVTKTSRERHVLRNLYTFFTLNNLVIFSIFSAVWQYVTAVVKSSDSNGNVWDALQEGKFFLTVMTSLCQISPFWVTWILQRNLGAAIDIAQLWTLFYQWFAKTFMAPTPRQYIEWTAPPAFDYANYYNYFLFYATVSLCFATLQPIILVCAAIYFIVDAVLKKYLLTYVFITKHESGGQFWRTLFNRLVFACMLADFVIAILVAARDQWAMVGVTLPLILLMGGFKYFCMKKFDNSMDYYTTSAIQDSERLGGHEPSHKAIGKASVKFRHPALDQRLMTPMIAQKARHLVSEVYSGRLSSESVHQYYEDSDIPMEPMKHASQTAPFEVVPDGQQDFAYYKDRPDFQEISGDNIGKPEDLISLRTGTPASMMKGPYFSQTPYQDDDSIRAASPSGIKRKAVGQGNVHPALRKSYGSYDQLTQADEASDIGLGPKNVGYNDPNDDSANLLKDVGDLRSPTGDFMSLDQFRTNDSSPSSRQDGGGGSYDYFRGSHR